MAATQSTSVWHCANDKTDDVIDGFLPFNLMHALQGRCNLTLLNFFAHLRKDIQINSTDYRDKGAISWIRVVTNTQLVNWNG